MEEEFSLLIIVNEISVQPNVWNKESSATKGFWVPLLQRILYKIHQHEFSLQVYISNALPKACIYMDENKAISKVEEVETIKKIKVNDLTNLKKSCVLFLNVKGQIRGYGEEQPANDPWVAIRATREYIHSRLAKPETCEWFASCI